MRANGLRWSDVLESAPESWKRVPLGEVFEERKEQNHPDLPLLSVTAEHGVVPRDSLTRRDTSNPDKSRYLRVCPGDIVYNTMRMWQGVSALASEEGIVSPAYTVCTPRPSIDATFASYLLKVQALVNVFRNRSQGLVDDTLSLRFDEFAKIRIPLPPLAEQKRITEIIGSVDEAIQATRAVIEQTRKVKQGMLHELLTRGIGHTRFKQTEIGELPEGWGVTTLGRVGTWTSGGTPSKRQPEYWRGDIPWVSPKDMKRARIDDAADHVSQLGIENGTRLTPAGSILVVVRGMILAHSFPVAMTTKAVSFNQDIKALVVREDFSAEFLLYWLQYREAAFVSLVDTASHGTKRVPTEALMASAIPRPHKTEQIRIAEALSNLDVSISKTESMLVNYGAVKQGLMHTLLHGRIGREMAGNRSLR